MAQIRVFDGRAGRAGVGARSIAGGVGLLLLAACTVGNDYQRPAVDAPAQFRFAKPLPGAADRVATMETSAAAREVNRDWWRQFGDPVLDDLIVQALSGNRNLRVALANVDQAAGVLAQTRSAFFPQLGYQGQAARQRASRLGANPIPSGSPNTADALSALLVASWEIDLWGRLRRASEAAQANLLAAQDVRRGIMVTLVAQVATAYIQLRGLDEQYDIALRTRQTYAASLDLFKLQFRHGVVSRMAIAQAESALETATAQIPLIELQRAQTENALSVLLGRNPGPIVRGKSILEMTLPVVPAGLPSDLLEQRPDLRASEQQLVAANARVGVAKAAYYPDISLTGALGQSSAQLSDLFKGPARTWSFGAGLTGPIFTAGAIAAQVAQAEAAQRAAIENYQIAIQNAFADVDDALVARAKLVEQNEAQARLVLSLSDYSHLARLQYTGGYTPYFTVLQAEQQLFPAQLSWAGTRAQLLASMAALYQASGGAWVTAAESLVGSSAAPTSGSGTAATRR